MSPEAGFDTLCLALADIEQACERDELERAAVLMEMFDYSLRGAHKAGRLDAGQLQALQAGAVRLVARLSQQRDRVAEEMARAHTNGRAVRAYLGDT